MDYTKKLLKNAGTIFESLIPLNLPILQQIVKKQPSIFDDAETNAWYLWLAIEYDRFDLFKCMMEEWKLDPFVTITRKYFAHNDLMSEIQSDGLHSRYIEFLEKHKSGEVKK